MPPFAVLHICMGNICRSPMAERLLRLAVAETAGVGPGGAEALLLSHSAGTGGWHEGKAMNPPAARQLRARGGEDAGFAARKLRAEHIDGSDLVLCATAEQQQHVREVRPDAVARTFVLGQFGRLLPHADLAALPPPAATSVAVYQRGVALVAAVDAARSGNGPTDGDDLDDPWGHSERTFARVADEIQRTVRPLAVALLEGRHR
jgi:protein-tyrosine phosphatase